MKRIILILPDVRSVYNVASMFRTADAAGVEKIILAGYTPGPLDRFGRVRKDFAKVSLGAEHTVPWESLEDAKAAISRCREQGFTCVALEQTQKAEHYRRFRAPEKIALILGNEVEGVSPDILNSCEAIIEIPMSGRKESLNVEVAAGIALFSLRDQ